MENLIIGQTGKADLQDVLSIVKNSFADDEVAELVRDLWQDPSARPSLSLIARHQERPVGYILFTRAKVRSNSVVKASILAPLAVIPEFQNRGVGEQLIGRGLALLTQHKVALAFVLGYPDYYSRHGFQPAGRLGFEAPYPIAEKNHDAWMVQELQSGGLDGPGIVQCAKTMDRPEYWRE